ncbi:hypothetical protein SUGI_0294380 [Cryptomeria japonica]|nr:hypothetical protein SUGI_0294380 [Cryptomeria japonica]
MHSAALKAFIISNTFGMCFSMSALILCFNVRIKLFEFVQETSLSLRVTSTFNWANNLVQLAFLATMVSYSSALYVLVAPNCLWLAIITTTVACLVPFVGIVWKIVLAFKLWQLIPSILMFRYQHGEAAPSFEARPHPNEDRPPFIVMNMDSLSEQQKPARVVALELEAP